MIQATPMDKGRSEIARPLSIFQIAHHSDSNDIIDDNDGINNDTHHIPLSRVLGKGVVSLYTDKGRIHGHPDRH